jgi:hypothetical protein
MQLAAMKNKRLSDKKQKPASEKFDPFNDRLSRDIRNSLTDAFMTSLKQKDAGCYLDQSQKLLKREPAPVYKDYIQDRVQRYGLVFERIQQEHIDNARIQAVILWNNGLFFEVHDILEDIWHKKQGDERRAIQGLIKAAGVYVHLESDRLNSAERLALKSVRLIKEYDKVLGFISNLSVLISALENGDPVPPTLKLSSPEQERNKYGRPSDQ